MKIEFDYIHTLTLIFVIAKITGYIDWSWWLVFLPSIAPLIITVLCLTAYLLILAWEWVRDR